MINVAGLLRKALSVFGISSDGGDVKVAASASVGFGAPDPDAPDQPVEIPAAIEKQGWSKDVHDCHKRIRDAYPLVEAEFVSAHPDCKLKPDYSWRSQEFQFSLFKKGREMQNGVWVVIDETKVVTQKNGSTPSHHQTYPAQALDHYIVRNGSIVWPDEKNAATCALYAYLGSIWNKHDIVSGATWKFKNFKDYGHVQVAYEIL